MEWKGLTVCVFRYLSGMERINGVCVRYLSGMERINGVCVRYLSGMERINGVCVQIPKWDGKD